MDGPNIYFRAHVKRFVDGFNRVEGMVRKGRSRDDSWARGGAVSEMVNTGEWWWDEEVVVTDLGACRRQTVCTWVSMRTSVRLSSVGVNKALVWENETQSRVLR